MSTKQVVYVLQHHREDRDSEDVKLIGIYSSAGAAAGAIERLRNQPGFEDYPDGFSVDPYVVDADHWTQGFGTPSDAT